MSNKAQQFSSWGVAPFNWLNVDPAELEKNFVKNLNLLLNTNPIITQNKPPRQYGCEVSLMRKRVKESVEDRFVERIPSFGTNEELQNELEKFITNHLATSHYSFVKKLSANGKIGCVVRQFWFPASYYICGVGNEEGAKTLKMWFIDEKFCHDEFYDVPGTARYHPAIVIECLENGLFLMVPFTHSDGDGKLKVKISGVGISEEQFAIYKFYFEASKAMLDMSGTEDYKRRTISDDDFNLLVNEIKK